MPRLRIIRQVIRMGRDGRPKVVRDIREGMRVERVNAAQAPRRCYNEDCETEQIEWKQEYIKVIPLRYSSYGRRYPQPKDYHINCVPENLQPCLRFFS